ncbi:MAG: hypothetical protein HYY18_18745 [Planctomycetes bacterium]|nr:hypothetical protein [Planctomycetota bacterium]
MRLAPAAVLVVLCGCADSTRMVAEYAPGRSFSVTESSWVPGAALRLPNNGPDMAQLDSGAILSVVSGEHDVVLFARKADTDDVEIAAWVELDGDHLAAAAFWVRDWGGETVWYAAISAEGMLSVDRTDEDWLRGTLDLRFKGLRMSAREGSSGPFTFRLRGNFRAESSSPR